MLRCGIYHYCVLEIRGSSCGRCGTYTLHLHSTLKFQDFFLPLLRVLFGGGGGGGGGAGVATSSAVSSSNTNFFTTMCSLTRPPTGSSALSTLPSVSSRRACVG